MESADEGKKLSPPSSSTLSTSSDLNHAAAAAATEPPESTTSPRKREVDNTGKGSSGPCSSSLPKHPTQSNGSTTGNDLRTESATTLGKANNVSNTGEILSHPTCDGSEAIELGATDKEPTSLGLEAPPLSQPAVDGNIDELNMDSDSAATQSPLTQVMERPGDPTSSPSYRIPDYVFARNKSTAPMEWSTASNESLFSIQMGNMSFTRDQFGWLGKSGELGLPGEVYLPSSNPHNIDFTSNQPPSKQTVEVPQKSCGNSDELPSPRVTEAKAAETMREVIRENAEDHDKSNAQNREKHAGGKYHSSRHSHASDGSTRSFAFPILAGDGDPNCSVRGGSKHRHYSPSKPRSQRESGPPTPKEKPKETPNASQTPKSNPNIAKCRWGLSCFSCCPSCCS